MRRRDVIVLAMAGVLGSTGVLAADRKPRRERAEERRRGEESNRLDRRRNRDEEFAARAANDDPAGNYKSYPDWARATLGNRVFGK